MTITAYQKHWNTAQPLMKAKLEQLSQLLAEKSHYNVGEIYQAGDEEFNLSTNLMNGDVTVLGIDLILADAEVRGDEEGVGINLTLVGPGGLFLGGYAPFNYSSQVFTTDADDVAERITGLDVPALADYIVTEVLTDQRLLAALQSN